MAKSIRSKIKRKFRTELRKRIGAPHLEKQQEKIQEELRKAIASPSNRTSVLELKQFMGTSDAPIAIQTPIEIVKNEVEMTDVNAMNLRKMKLNSKSKKPQRKKTQKNKFVQFHLLRKKGS
uniref:AlNc14C4G567 protein n=1 Tax=Albugo laibachii Nc14 TaxID=890382 RepID=F0W0C4_9STRA|nr:AlNc14C4G567 [Albugo laibachii Nc14]|eukprot:CCA14496.1 AlNc14C4G567 [Albugo laibachii Nc14]